MFKRCEQTIIFKPSRDYIRCVLLIYVIAGYSILQSAYILELKMVLTVFLMTALGKILRSPFFPSPVVKLLEPGYLYMYDGNIFPCDDLRLCFEHGLFLYFSFKVDDHKKHFVLFRDQITASDYSYLKWFARDGNDKE